MARIKEKIAAQKLRQKGWSIRDIADKVGVSKGSVGP